MSQSPENDALTQAKTALRAAMRRARREAARRNPDAAAALAATFLRDGPEVAAGTQVAGYSPIGWEIDPRPLMTHLAGKGVELALPCVEGADAPLVFRRWADGDPLVDGLHGTRQPTDKALAILPDVVLVPLVAFDRAGHRLGQGGGYYDRALAALRGKNPALLAIGLAYEGQMVDAVPAAPHDARLDWIVTEKRAYCTARDQDRKG
jgi:5-formyltetrahydrofolate cyclo-ligase